jgi:hypothetical protein
VVAEGLYDAALLPDGGRCGNLPLPGAVLGLGRPDRSMARFDAVAPSANSAIPHRVTTSAARCALAAAQSPSLSASDRKRLLRSATSDARRIESENVGWEMLWRFSSSRGRLVEGDRTETSRLAAAQSGFESAKMALYSVQRRDAEEPCSATRRDASWSRRRRVDASGANSQPEGMTRMLARAMDLR